MLVLVSTLWLSISLQSVWTLAQSPTVALDTATVTGNASGSVYQFLGIPYAKPPIGSLRLNLPQPVDAYTGAIDATAYGTACPQQLGAMLNISGLPVETLQVLANVPHPPFTDGEDCLSLNVITPNLTVNTAKLPVVVWIYGGGFQDGTTILYNGSVIVERSIAMGEPIIFVSMNYRLSAFGFLPGKEVKEAGIGNLGLHDQRLALRWVQDHIKAFGGDPTKVTIWGESTGALSVALHMVIHDGDTEGLFRAAFMQSGSPLPTVDIETDQQYYDAIVDATGCAGSIDTLACLRTLPYDTLKAASDNATAVFDSSSFGSAYGPHTDGALIPKNVYDLVKSGKIAQVPVVSGDCDDEGTILALPYRDITTDAALKDHMQRLMFKGVPEPDIDNLMTLYPNVLSLGSPYNTGDANALYPQFKRLASLTGDYIFQAPRRFFFSVIKQDIYSYSHKRMKSVPILGSFHSTDLHFNSFLSGGDIQPYLIRFVAHLDPNGGMDVHWPRWTSKSPKLLTFNDGAVPINVTEDTYREVQTETLTKLRLEFP